MRECYFLVIIILCSLYTHSTDEAPAGYRGLASSWALIPSRSLAGLHYIFKGYEEFEEKGIVKVSGPVMEITNGKGMETKVYSEGYLTEMDLEDFEEEQKLALSVFEATTRTGNSVGTAFLVGQDIVLTNRHVMGYSADSRKWECGKFAIKLNHREETIDCERVRFCSPQYDYCVIEMKKMESGASLGEEVKPLRLTNRVRNHQDILLLHIGNAAGLGIQASRGRGLKIKGGEFYHYAPTLGGSSGAPIINEKGEVIGINWGHTGANYIDDASFNRGVLSLTIFKELSKTHLKTLLDIKSFRFWHHRNKRHREVRLKSFEHL
jgi:hypothetical protein